MRVESLERLRPGRLTDPALGALFLTGHALGVDPQQDGHAVPRPFGDLSRRTPVPSRVDTAACRRSYGVLARGETASRSPRSGGRRRGLGPGRRERAS